MCTFGLSGCRVKPRRPTRLGRRGSHTTARELQTCTFHGPGASNTTKIPRKEPKREKEERKLWREEEKKARNFGLHPSGLHPSGLHPLRGSTFSRFGPPTFGAPTFGAHFFWVWASTLGTSLWGPHPWWSKNSISKNWPKSKLAEVDIGRTRKKKLAEVEIGRSRSRSRRRRGGPNGSGEGRRGGPLGPKGEGGGGGGPWSERGRV